MQFSDREKYARLKLFLSDNIGPVTYRDLIRLCKSAENALEQIPAIIQRSTRKRTIKIASDEIVSRQFEMAQKLGVHILFQGEDDYPQMLNHLNSCPPILFAWGRKELLQRPSISLVGSRSASANGQTMAKKLAYSFASRGYTVVSGLALGIDGASHIGALSADTKTGGSTIAVLGSGVDVIYPPEHKKLYETIKEQGCLLSEFVFGLKATHTTFPRRNRIIAGLSKGTVVVEATKMSGSLITAKEALEQGREVFAVPGSPLDPRSEGPNYLIMNGAHLVTHPDNVTDVLEAKTMTGLFSDIVDEETEFAPLLDNDSHIADTHKKLYELVLSKLSSSVTSIETLLHETGLSVSQLNSILVEMELEGKIERFAGNNVALTINIEWDK